MPEQLFFFIQYVPSHLSVDAVSVDLSVDLGFQGLSSGLISLLGLLLRKLLLLLFGEVNQRLVLAGLEVTVVSADDGISVVDGNRTDVGQLLDLGGTLLKLRVGHVDVELFATRLDRVPASETRREVDVAGHAEVGRVDDFVGGGVVEDGLGVDASLVGKGAEAGDVVVEGNVDLDGLGDKILNFLELVELVLALDVFGVGDDHARHETTERSDTVTLANTKNGGIDVSSTTLKSAVCVGDSATSVVVEMGFDVAVDDTAKDTDEFVDLAGRRAADGVSDTDTVDADLVDSGVNGEEIDEVGAEGVFAGEADLDTLGLDEFDDFDGGVLDVGHILAVRVFAEV